MSGSLEFAKTYRYNNLKSEISLLIILQSGETSVEIHAKLDSCKSLDFVLKS